jgi:hypothetical protein
VKLSAEMYAYPRVFCDSRNAFFGFPIFPERCHKGVRVVPSHSIPSSNGISDVREPDLGCRRELIGDNPHAIVRPIRRSKYYTVFRHPGASLFSASHPLLAINRPFSLKISCPHSHPSGTIRQRWPAPNPPPIRTRNRRRLLTSRTTRKARSASRTLPQVPFPLRWCPALPFVVPGNPNESCYFRFNSGSQQQQRMAAKWTLQSTCTLPIWSASWRSTTRRSTCSTSFIVL